MSKGKLTLTTIALAGLGVAMSGVAYADGTVVGGGRSGDSKWIDIVGYAQVDHIWTADRNNGLYASGAQAQHLYPGGSNIRSARLGVEGGLGDGLTYRLRTDFTDPALSREAVVSSTYTFPGSRIADAFVNYQVHDAVSMTVGQFGLPLGLENASDSQNLMFMERGMGADTFLSGEKMGLMFSGALDDYNTTLTGALFQGKDKTLTNFTSTGNVPRGAEPTAYFGRVTWAPEYDGTNLHVGLSGTHQPLGSINNEVMYRAPYELVLRASGLSMAAGAGFNHNFYNNSGTGAENVVQATLTNVKTVENAALELAVQRGSLLVQSDVTYNKNKRDPLYVTASTAEKEVNFRGYSVQAGYVLTGEARPYHFKSGSFGGVNPRGKHGAWEATARFSSIDMTQGINSGDATRGDTRNVTLGLNWFRNNAFSAGVNYVHVKLPYRTGNSDNFREVDMVGMRAQFVF